MLLAVWAFTPQAEIHRCHQAVTGTKAKKKDLAPLAPQASVLQVKSHPVSKHCSSYFKRKGAGFPGKLARWTLCSRQQIRFQKYRWSLGLGEIGKKSWFSRDAMRFKCASARKKLSRPALGKGKPGPGQRITVFQHDSIFTAAH